MLRSEIRYGGRNYSCTIFDIFKFVIVVLQMLNLCSWKMSRLLLKEEKP